AAKQELHKAKIEYFDRTASAVILVSGGYPGSYTKGFEITGIDNCDNAITFHAGTCTNQNGKLSTSGGRVLASVGIENNIAKALNIAYTNAETIDFKGKYYRTDIGKDLI
ncbi:MAG TPA: phosphoribosylglycinamide synthetase C domain-containing protein, partial [Tenuifilaceae bacterium]|nr:phosphoribosylglycinamide synthetase C domain-containing protein [Tenuifilaceae bacterium]